MTDREFQEEEPTSDHRERPKKQFVSPWMGVLMLALVVGLLFWFIQYGATKQDNRNLEANLFELADGVTKQCDAGKPVYNSKGQNLCPVAKDATENPKEIAAPKDGRGIVGSTIEGGALILTYSDGEKENVGHVVGAKGQEGDKGDPGEPGKAGEPGEPGEPGRGITGSDIIAGELVLAFSDSTSRNMGPVVGPAGVGFVDAIIQDNSLVLVLSNGQTINAGALPPGPPGATGNTGAPGADGQPPLSWQEVDPNTGEVTKTCQRTEPFDPAAPRYVCTGQASPPPSQQPTPEPTTTTAPAA